MKKSIKSFWSAVLSVTMAAALFAMPAVSAEENEPITVFVDGKQIEFDVEPIMESDRVLVPMRFIFEALGADVSWDDPTSTATAVKDETTINITINSNIMLKNGEEIVLDVPARLIGERTLVPVRAVSEGLEASVEWDGESQKVNIETKNQQEEDKEETDKLPESSEENLADDNSEENTADDNSEENAIDNNTKENSAEDNSKEETADDGEYSFDELSEKDLQALKDSYGDIRYAFEQYELPKAVLLENEELKKAIQQKDESVCDFVRTVWDSIAIAQTIVIQTESDTTYTINDGDIDKLTNGGYLPLLKEAGLNSESIFDVSFETLENGSPLLMLTFKNTDTLLACKYIGICVKNNTVRYFTAETDIMSEELFICEVLTDKRGTVFLMDKDGDFKDAVNEILEKDLGLI